MPEMNKPPQMGAMEQALRAFSSETAQRIFTGSEWVPALGTVTSVVSFFQHSIGAYYDWKDGKPLRAMLDAAGAVADIGQALTDVIPIAGQISDALSTFIEAADWAVEFLEPLFQKAKPAPTPTAESIPGRDIAGAGKPRADNRPSSSFADSIMDLFQAGFNGARPSLVPVAA